MRFCSETLGCKVNQYETQALETILLSRGHAAAQPGEGCDTVIINTCAVTAESGRKSRQAVRRLHKLEPGAVIAVCGCFSQVSPEEASALGADLVAGSGDRHAFADALERLVRERTAVRLIDDPARRRVFEELPAGSVAGRTRAMLKIQDGCQNFCAYCIIPYARGPVRSLPLERAAAEAARLNAEGYGEIVVTGIEISSYGKDLEGGVTLIDALEAVGAAAPAARLRLGSLEPRTITEEFAARLKGLPNLCDHFHLSLQSGCDATLKRMKRRYTTDGFYEAVCLLRRYFPGCGITADLIVGFPGETEEEFEATLAFIKKCAFSAMHVFPYSVRPGTPAAVMDGQVDKQVKHARARRASAAARAMSRAFAESCVGTTLDVLFEREEDGVCCGHAGNYLEVGVSGAALRNQRLKVYINCEKNGNLFGEIV
ncbi:threonylcarbamoyladenosine tRNA methylthiotransferase MtaB [Sporobacter termitidis DSM 10068]|uniref:Threonylcarbamoyladenosine tRNA methylthiotransferase MtaB n=1 Tax=Sporobacter termitidis DSM 10068 TaxID=1123282 RepID=A0A1M5YFL2_9FIRM|nr:tRNA (N(6)-L-threonylcarbamoyladenosine(37)-C(2))-methylthiotransferase MtaB [Sporobacter termitidis]SHI10638.1 threonylcarbamoyladenosine tRNA methylthiotransferase MtaB [Sporobacter termitidis DSM 10068]